jgi:uncharacterized protein YndB with AHSA1/START domain
MTSNAHEGRPTLGSLGSAEGKGIVRMEDRFDTGIDDVWSALTDPSRLVRWYGEVEGDLRLGGEYRARLFASGWEGTGRVEACDPPRRLLVRIKDADEPDENVIEVTLTEDGDQTTVVWEERGMPVGLLSAYGGRSTAPCRRPRRSPRWARAPRRRDGTMGGTPPCLSGPGGQPQLTTSGVAKAAWASVREMSPEVRQRHFSSKLGLSSIRETSAYRSSGVCSKRRRLACGRRRLRARGRWLPSITATAASAVASPLERALSFKRSPPARSHRRTMSSSDSWRATR